MHQYYTGVLLLIYKKSAVSIKVVVECNTPSFALLCVISVERQRQELVIFRAPYVRINAVPNAHELVSLASDSWVTANLLVVIYTE